MAALLLFGCLAACLTLATSSLTVRGKSISDGYVLPTHKQGYDDQRYMSSTQVELQTRTDMVQALFAPSVRKQNLFWHLVETINLTSPNPDLVCGNGGFMWPPNSTVKNQLGVNNFHCYSLLRVRLLDKYMNNDAAYGIETAAVLWGSPFWYIHPNCTGAGGGVGQRPCSPRPENISAWYDFVAFVGDRWPSATHLIIWNEAGSSSWFDPSPYANNTGQNMTGTSDADTWIDMYANMLVTAHDAIYASRTLVGRKTLMYVSTDRMLTNTPWCPGPKWGARCPLGTWKLLNGLWKRLGSTMDWSLSLHLFGEPNSNDWKLTQPYQAYSYVDIPKMILYQQSWLINDSSVQDYTRAPQAVVAGTEESWNTGTPAAQNTTAWYVCLAHNYTLGSATMAFSTLMDLQDPYNMSGVPSGNYGLIPHDAGPYLNGTGAAAPTFAAYASTSPYVWNQRSDHFCCATYSLGCRTAIIYPKPSAAFGISSE